VILAALADALTLSRMGLAAVVAFLIGTGRAQGAAVVLAIAWLTDFLDGRVAGEASAPTRLGAWDMPADVVLGAGAVVGLGLARELPSWLSALAVALLGGGYVALRQPALGMALQGLGYGGTLWLLFANSVPTRGVPVAVALGIWVSSWSKFWRVELPEFFRGIAAAARLRRGTSLELTEG